MGWLNRFFELDQRNTTVRRELRGAVATFLTMAYILFVNPDILSKAGVPYDSAVACTAAAAAICCILMGAIANFPIALASGMGLNALVAFQIASTAGSWQTAMGLVVWDGVVILLLVILGMREAIMNAIPRDLRRAIGAGIGLFIALIGAVNAKLVVPTGVPNPPITNGTLWAPETAVAVIGLLFTAFLMARKVQGALIYGIVGGTLLGFAFGVTRLPQEFAWPSFEIAFQADITGALSWKLVPFLFALFMVDFFDTLGTVTALAEEGHLADEKGQIIGLRRILLVDAVSSSIGGLLGVSSVTSYIESAAGVAEGARTGLHNIFVGLFFVVAIFAAPLAGIVPSAATAPALIIVGFLMASQIARIDFENMETGIPAFITLIAIPFTYSIAHGIGLGFIAFVVIKVLSLKLLEVHWMMYLTAAIFVVFFLWGKG